MAKKKKATKKVEEVLDQEIQEEETPQEESPTYEQPAQVAGFMDRLVNSNKKFNTFQGSDRLIVGLEPYSLALQYMMDLQVLPLQSLILISGLPKTYKTSTALEFCKLAVTCEDPGMGYVIHTEGKWSPSKAKGMMQEYDSAVTYSPVTSVQEWQEAASNVLTTYKDVVKKKNDAIAKKAKTSEYKDLRIPPCVIAVDSMTGSQTDNIKDKVQTDGFGAKTFQDRAMIIWQWMGTWGTDILGLPVSVVITQHLKDNIDASPMSRGPKHSTSGGTGGDYHCSMEIRTKKIKELKTANSEGALLEWQCFLNSLGIDKRKIQVEYVETWDDDDNRISYFDWDGALMNLIDTMDEKGSADAKKRIKAVLGEHGSFSKAGVGKLYHCECLGIDKKRAAEENITAQDVGRMLQTGEFRAPLRKALRVQDAQPWTTETKLEDLV